MQIQSTHLCQWTCWSNCNALLRVQGHGTRKRHNEHKAASKQKSEVALWSNFYSSYPDLVANGGKKGKLGNFNQVKQITGVRYKKEHIQLVVNMFQWEEKTIAYLDAKNTSGAETLVAKQHRMVCYFLKSYLT